MREVLTTLRRWRQAGEATAVATLVRAWGSVPWRPGARLGLTRSGKMVGSVSGGCVENDVCAHALRVLASGQPVLVHYAEADELGPAVGLSCGGSIDVLVEPFVDAEAWQVLCHAIDAERSAVLGVGLTPPSVIGRKLVVFDDGTCAGSFGAGFDAQIVAAAQRLLVTGGTRVLSIGAGSGAAAVFLEALPTPQRLFIIGGTHTAIPLCRLAKVCGFRVAVADARRAYATAERFPDADELLLEPPDAVLSRARGGAAYVVILTHDPKFDLPALAGALRSDVRYIGILGSRTTHERRKAALREQGFTETDLARIHAPIGLDLGARTPEEIALAILAEMVAVRHGRAGGPALGAGPAGLRHLSLPGTGSRGET
jgi:xanthine dehydrogenase accessory factor